MSKSRTYDIALYVFWFVFGCTLIFAKVMYQPKREPLIRVKYDPPTSEEVGKATGKMSKGFTKGFVKGVLEKEENENTKP